MTVTQPDSVLAWHFVGDTLRDGRPVPADGELLRHDEPMALCRSGLHASIRAINALTYAPGNTICRVRMAVDIKHKADKLIARERTILWRLDAADVLRAFARQCALDVAHLWDMPDEVRQYLEAGNDSLRVPAWAAAWAAARSATIDAARDAAWATTRAATRDAARAAARDAAWAATRAAAWAAAWAAARSAARDAAWAAARVAARDAAWDAAWDATRAVTRDSTIDAQNTRLEAAIYAAAVCALESDR